MRGKSALFVAILACPVTIAPLVAAPAIEKSVVRIVNHAQRPSWYTPWGTGAMQWTTGSGFVIEGGLIMTNAHVVSDSRFLALFLYGDPNPHEGRVVVEGHDCDLALIRPVEPKILEGVPALSIGGLPSLRSMVETYGYPSGGDQISSTQGVVSRIDRQLYAHSAADGHLAVQTDAAINPGNSGGPVVQEGKIVGVAFQNNKAMESVGFFIPTEVIRHFLADAKDGTYAGYPDLAVRTASLENPAARRLAGMQEGESGVRVDWIAPDSSADGWLRTGDILLRIEGETIANDGSVASGELTRKTCATRTSTTAGRATTSTRAWCSCRWTARWSRPSATTGCRTPTPSWSTSFCSARRASPLCSRRSASSCSGVWILR